MNSEAENKRIIDFIENSPELAEAREYGVDLWALWANLQRTPEERLHRLQITNDMIQEIRRLNV